VCHSLGQHLVCGLPRGGLLWVKGEEASLHERQAAPRYLIDVRVNFVDVVLVAPGDPRSLRRPDLVTIDVGDRRRSSVYLRTSGSTGFCQDDSARLLYCLILSVMEMKPHRSEVHGDAFVPVAWPILVSEARG
jgi:hypothetical protein